MIALIIIGILLLIILTGVLFLPIGIVINTDKKEYYIKQPLIFKTQIVSDTENILKIRVRILFIPIAIYPFKLKGKTSDIKKKTSKKKKRRKIRKPYQLFRKLIQAIKIKRMNADIDTGNFPLNAQLIPIVQLINGNRINININFEDQVRADIYVVTHLYKLLMARVSHSTRSGNKNII